MVKLLVWLLRKPALKPRSWLEYTNNLMQFDLKSEILSVELATRAGDQPGLLTVLLNTFPFRYQVSWMLMHWYFLTNLIERYCYANCKKTSRLYNIISRYSFCR